MNRYDVTVTRDGKWWMVRIPAIDGLTQARRLEEAPLMARDYIAIVLDVPIADVEVDVSVIDVHGVDIAAEVAEIETQRAEAEAARARATEATRRLARRLADENVPVRDIGAILKVSHQRAHQLVG
jgi:hypothetical protein